VKRSTRTKPPGRKRWGFLDNRGAVYVEFLASFMPIFFAFWCLLQSAGLYAAKLVVRNSAYLGARAAAVVIPDDGKKYGGTKPGTATGKRKSAIDGAVRQGLAANKSIIQALTIIKLSSGGGQAKTSFGRDEIVTVTVTAPYRCRLPLADKVVCGLGGFAILNASASMAVHGADYDYP